MNVSDTQIIEMLDGSRASRAAIHKKSTELCSVVAVLTVLILRRAQLFSMELVCPVCSHVYTDVNFTSLSY